MDQEEECLHSGSTLMEPRKARSSRSTHIHLMYKDSCVSDHIRATAFCSDGTVTTKMVAAMEYSAPYLWTVMQESI